MLKKVVIKLWGRCLSNPWFVIRFAIVTALASLIGKAILIGTVEAGEAPEWAAQFAPTIPMMLVTFCVHRFLWDHKRTSLLSHVGGHWSLSYWGQFIAGHGLFTLFAVHLGLKYWAVSMAIGVFSAGVTFALNELKIFVRRSEMETVRA